MNNDDNDDDHDDDDGKDKHTLQFQIQIMTRYK